MADNTRRSGRATKGQHTRNLDEEAPTTPNLRGGGKGSKGKKGKNQPSPPPEEEPPAIIRCVCGYVEEDADDERKMIICETCEAWQHNECMDLPDDDDKLPEEYYCEQCMPQNHQKLLAEMSRGERPWEERARQRERREQEEEEKKDRRRKGKKGRKGRASEVKKEEVQTNGAMATEPAAPPPEEAVEAPEDIRMADTAPEVESNKRKLPEEPIAEPTSPTQRVCEPAQPQDPPMTVSQEPAGKQRRISTPSEKPPPPQSSRRKSTVPVPASKPPKRDSNAVQLQPELVEKISDLNITERKKVAEALQKLFVGEVKKAEKEQSFSIPQGEKIDELALRLALSVEYALYLNFWGREEKASAIYGDRFRSILHNVKANTELRNRLLEGSLYPNDFVKMNSEEMANKERKEENASILKETEKQHVIIPEEGPRIRRTHKGEELVDDHTHIADGADSAFSAPMRKRPSEIDTTMKDPSPVAASPNSPVAVELPETINASLPTTNQPLTVDTQAQPAPSADPDRKSASTFDIEGIWSGVRGPDTDAQRVRQPSRASEPAGTPAQHMPGPVQADAEIDQLLREDEPEDEEPYSPVDFTAESGSAIWHGSMAMTGIASFNGKAKHIAGANLSASIPWSQLIPTALTIEGRIDIERASEYLCGLRFSHTTDVTVVAVTPVENQADITQFDKLFRYFTDRSRYGVISKNPIPSVKDTYVVPLEANTSKKPEFIELLEICTIEEPTPERMLLLTFVIKSQNSPSAQQTPRQPDANPLASPVGSQMPNPMQHPGFQSSPSPAQPFPPPQPQLPPYANSPQQQQTHPYMPLHNQSPYAPHQQHLVGMEAARQALGELANAPVVGELLAEAPMTGLGEFMVMRDMLQNVPASQSDFGMLKGLLALKSQQGQGGQ